MLVRYVPAHAAAAGPPKPKTKKGALAAGAVALVALTGGGVAYAAASSSTATCTANPTITAGATAQSFDVHCSVPNVVVTSTVTSTVTAPPRTVTVTASPSSSTSTSSTTTSSTSTASQTSTSTSTTAPPTGAWPGATTTGARGTLTKRSGTVTLSTAGQVYENIELTGNIDVRAPGVTIRNVKINATGYWGIDLYSTGAVIQDVTVIGSKSTVGGVLDEKGSTRMTRMDISGTEDGVKIDSNSTLEDSYIHDLYYNPTTDTHNDALQFSGHGGITVRHNKLLSPNSGTSAILMGGGESRPAEHDSRIVDNYMAGGAYTFYGPYGAPIAGKSSNVTVTGNRFSVSVFVKGGKFGSNTQWEDGVGGSNVWSDNRWVDGPSAGQLITPGYR
jgi:hypothetical protein